jgi:hypothetical protein
MRRFRRLGSSAFGVLRLAMSLSRFRRRSALLKFTTEERER